jgi:hypothetical protein
VLIPFREDPETRPGYPCRAFRWTFQANRDFVGFIHQYESEGEWHDSHTTVNGVWWVGRPWRLPGFVHAWYDGPHCCWHVGPISVQWNNPGCRWCSPSERRKCNA